VSVLQKRNNPFFFFKMFSSAGLHISLSCC